MAFFMKIVSSTYFYKLGVVLLGLISFSVSLQAYGPTGHRVIGKIAQDHLSLEAAAAVKEILGHETLAEVSTWSDWIKSDPAWDHAYTWHYVSIADGETYEESIKNSEGDAIVKLLDFQTVLGSSSSTLEEKRVALKWLVHLVGDLHQPLHVGHAEDKGGNDNKVVWFGEDSNLHRIWDSGLIDYTGLSFTEMAESIDRRIDVVIESGPKPEVMLWVEEALELRESAYEEPGPRFGDSYRYVFDKLGLIEIQLKKGGLRLAMLIEDALVKRDEWTDMPLNLHWVRNSAEYQALTRQVYKNAETQLMKLHRDGALDGEKEWAVALDADETILDNSLFAKEQKGATFDPVAWDEWCRRSIAPAVPGAIPFLKMVKELGGKVAIVTNRSIRTQQETEDNLRKLGIEFDVVLTKDKDSDKHPRWNLLEAGSAKEGLGPLELVMFLGDNIFDFPMMSQELVGSGEDSLYSPFGSKYFVLPNPTYGSFDGNPRK